MPPIGNDFAYDVGTRSGRSFVIADRLRVTSRPSLIALCFEAFALVPSKAMCPSFTTPVGRQSFRTCTNRSATVVR